MTYVKVGNPAAPGGQVRREMISQPFWDKQPVAAATATTQVTFFQSPRGGAAGRTLEDTNMTLAGQFPAPQSYFVKSVSFDVQQTIADAPGLNSEDVKEILDGTAQFFVGSKILLEAPLYWLVAGFGLTGVVGATAAAERQVWTNGLPGHPYKWSLKHHIQISPNENFRVDCLWETAFNSADAVDLVMVLDGDLMRGIQ